MTTTATDATAAAAAATATSAVTTVPVAATAAPLRPHIIFAMVDDLGWNYPGYHNPEVLTPTLDRLATTEGVRLESMYVYKYCSPSRGSLLSGRYPWHLASTRCNLIPSTIPEGLHLDYTLLPAHLARASYRSHHVGKWHLGFHTGAYTPVARGFNSSWGFLEGGEDHWDHACGAGAAACEVPWRPRGSEANFDLWEQSDDDFPGRPLLGYNGTRGDLATYSGFIFTRRVVELIERHGTDADADADADASSGSASSADASSPPLFVYWALHNTHAPIEAPRRFLDLYPHLANDTKRQTFSAMVSVVDEGVANVTRALKSRAGMWERTLLIWTTDNGSPIQVAGSNHPLRGGKSTNFEGGVRVPTFVSGGYLPSAMRGRVLHGLAHVADWYATFSELAGLGAAAPSDGPAPSTSTSLWGYVSGAAAASPRTELVHDHRMFANGTSAAQQCNGQRWFEMPGKRALGALRSGRWKLFVGPEGFAAWYGTFSPNASVAPDLAPVDCWDVCLFDVEADPAEHADVAAAHPDVVAALLERFEQLEAEYHPPVAPPPRDNDGFCEVVRAHDGWVAPGWHVANGAAAVAEPSVVEQA